MDSVSPFGPASWIDTGCGASDSFSCSSPASRILSCVPVRHLGSSLMQCLGFCLVFRIETSDQYWCGASDSVLGFGFAPRISTGAAPRILSRVPVRCLGSGLVRRPGFCLVSRSGALEQYWCSALDSVLGFGPAPQSDTGAAPQILSCVPVQHLGSILEHNLLRQLCNLEEINDQAADHTGLPNLQTQSAVTYQPSAHPMTGHLGVVGTR